MATSETDQSATMQVLGNDAWMRFDVWALRAWEASEKAAAIAVENGMINSNEDLDHRIVTLFHAASVAKDFATMANPLTAVACSGSVHGRGAVGAEVPGPSTLIITNESD